MREPSKNPMLDRVNKGIHPVQVYDKPETAACKEESDHPELWEEPYIWYPEEPHRPESPADPWPPAQERPPRPELLRLAQRLTDQIGHKVTTEDCEYWGLEGWITDDMLKVAKGMKKRVPMTLSQIAKACRMSEDEVKPILDEAAQVGLLEYNWENLDGKNPTHEKRWVLPVLVPGMGEFYAMNRGLLEEHPQMATYFERVAFVGPSMVAPMVPPGGGGLGMHVIPVEKAIEHENTTADIEHLSHWLQKYDRFSAGVCSCRSAETVRGVNAGDDPEGWCIGVGDMADYEVQTGKGYYITYEQVLEILQKAEDNGFIHQITNIDGEEKIFAICNCNKSICYALRTSQLFNTPNFSRSAYVARVETDKCVACGGCVEACPAGAVRLGQRLCTKRGPVEYPRHELPDDVEWGPDKWDLDYSNTNRRESYDTGTAPCKVACPAHVSVEGYLHLAAEGRYTEALALIKKENPFPAVCGRVCNHRCEDACTRGDLDDPVAIEAVKKFLAELDIDAQTRFVPPVVQPSLRGPYPDKIAIIGAGPAGLTCAYYLATRGYRPVVFEKSARPGGMLTYGIPTYKLEKDVVAAEIDIMRSLGVEIRCGVEVGTDITLDDLRAQGFEAFYVAIGAQGGRLPGIEGQDAAGVTSAVELMRAVLEADAQGEAGPQLHGKTVVVGGGNVAIDAARAAVRAHSDEVALYCLEQRDEMPADVAEVAEAEEEGVSVSCGWGPMRVETDENGKVCGVTFMRCTRVYDDQGRFAPVYEDTDTMLIPCDQVVFSVGQSIEWGDLLEGSAVELGAGMRAQADPQTFQTAQADVFVGGDALTGPSFVIDAIAAGHEAAESIHRYVHSGNSLTRGRNQRYYVELDKDDLSVPTYDRTPRQEAGVDQTQDRRHAMRDWHLTLTEDQVRKEVARCLHCGASVVDPNKCVGCGVCTTKCDFDAIHLWRERPECSTMYHNDDKLKAIIPYALKRRVKIIKRKLSKK